MRACYFLILASNAIIGWISIGLICRLLFYSIIPSKQERLRQLMTEKALAEIGTEQNLAEKIESIDLEEEVAPILDQRLEALVDQFRSQIPMAGMFLAGPFIERFKLKAKVEILKALPSIKNNLIQKIEREFDLKKLVKAKIDALDLEAASASIYKEGRKEIFKLQGLGALIGLFLGLVELVLLAWFC
ncbi:hypothetical protein [Candidatus Protochlamydia phocaeensis]|uniref:hypothetical protein n=1 Tax=Candidatus Protochlamydia phocaeensis TaxID=1414722 RepID=UPI000838C61E|nr:hypothetical protein [Candidatus Protochlamydia phocaeensis]